MYANEGSITSSTVKNSILCIFVFIGVTALVLIYFSIGSLEATEYGLDYSWLSKTIDPKIHQNGLYILGVGHNFIKFPKNVQTIEFSKEPNANRPPILSRTQDGLEVELEVSFQYSLQPENLYQLYNKYGSQYSIIFQNVAVDILTEEATKYTAYEFFWDRGRIKDDFQMNLDESFAKICFANVQFLQLRSVDLPNPFEEAIQESEVKKQDIKKAEAELNKVRVEVDTKIKSADFQKTVVINGAQAEATALLQQNIANIDSLKKVQTSQNQAYGNLKKNLQLDNKDLINYMKAKLLRNYEGSNLAVNLVSPEVSK